MARGTNKPASSAVAGPTKLTKRAPAAIIVTDDWPGEPPVMKQEIKVIETHLRSILDELLGPPPQKLG